MVAMNCTTRVPKSVGMESVRALLFSNACPNGTPPPRRPNPSPIPNLDSKKQQRWQQIFEERSSWEYEKRRLAARSTRAPAAAETVPASAKLKKVVVKANPLPTRGARYLLAGFPRPLRPLPRALPSRLRLLPLLAQQLTTAVSMGARRRAVPPVLVLCRQRAQLPHSPRPPRGRVHSPKGGDNRTTRTRTKTTTTTTIIIHPSFHSGTRGRPGIRGTRALLLPLLLRSETCSVPPGLTPSTPAVTTATQDLSPPAPTRSAGVSGGSRSSGSSARRGGASTVHASASSSMAVTKRGSCAGLVGRGFCCVSVFRFCVRTNDRFFVSVFL